MKIKNLFNSVNGLVINRRDSRGRTALYRAAKDGNLNKVRALLKKGADPNISRKNGLTPLHQAAYWGEVEIVRALLNAGADPNAETITRWTPLHSAAIAAGLSGRKEVIKLLLDKGAEPEMEDSQGWTPAHYASLWKGSRTELGKIRQPGSRHGGSDNHQPDVRKLGLKKPETVDIDGVDGFKENDQDISANDNAAKDKTAPKKTHGPNGPGR